MSNDQDIDIDFYLPSELPDEIQQIFRNCQTSSEVLDEILKIIGDSSKNSHTLEMVVQLLRNIAGEISLDMSETEFTILSLQNVFHNHLLSTPFRCQLLVAMVTVMLAQKHSSEFLSDVVQMLVNCASNKHEPIQVRKMCLTSLNEVEITFPGTLMGHINQIVNLKRTDDFQTEICELLTTLIASSSILDDQNKNEFITSLISLLPNMNPFTMITVCHSISESCDKSKFRPDLEQALINLQEKYPLTYDACILHTMLILQRLVFGNVNLKHILLCCTHASLSVARHLIMLEWFIGSSLDARFANYFEPTPFDGADTRLKKMFVLNSILPQIPQGDELFRLLLEHFIQYVKKSPTSRSLAAAFRSLKKMIEINFPTNASLLALQSTISMAIDLPQSLPHIVDFIKFTRNSGYHPLTQDIVLNIVDSYDERCSSVKESTLVYLIPFFIEASIERYEYCQPRIILEIIKKCFSSKDNKIIQNSQLASMIIDLCQVLVRQQDYEIIIPELVSVLSILEKNHQIIEIKQRSWMLRSLISHVQTDSLRDAFNIDLDLSEMGIIHYCEDPLISVNVQFDNSSVESQAVHWSLGRKRTNRCLYYPLEIKIVPHPTIHCTEFIGIRIDFGVDLNWGQIDSVYLPLLASDQVKRTYLHLQPKGCSITEVTSRAVLCAANGRIFHCPLERIALKLEHMMRPLVSSQSMEDLWNVLAAKEKFCTSILHLPQPDKVLAAIECGDLKKFQFGNQSGHLALVSPESLLLLVRMVSSKKNGSLEFLVEDSSLLPIAHSLFTSYC